MICLRHATLLVQRLHIGHDLAPTFLRVVAVETEIWQDRLHPHLVCLVLAVDRRVSEATAQDVVNAVNATVNVSLEVREANVIVEIVETASNVASVNVIVIVIATVEIVEIVETGTDLIVTETAGATVIVVRNVELVIVNAELHRLHAHEAARPTDVELSLTAKVASTISNLKKQPMRSRWIMETIMQNASSALDAVGPWNQHAMGMNTKDGCFARRIISVIWKRMLLDRIDHLKVVAAVVVVQPCVQDVMDRFKEARHQCMH